MTTPPSPNHASAAVMLVRLRAGKGIGERQRSVHLVPVPAANTMPEFLTAWCGTRISPGVAELLPTFAGMPCERCIAKAPVQTSGRDVDA